MLETSRKALSLAVGAFLACTGCNAMSPPADDGTTVTQPMRDACPMLTDEVIEGFILAISGLRDNGLGEQDALREWVDGCNNIPPDGNFRGDVEACRKCMPAVVNEVYAGT